MIKFYFTFDKTKKAQSLKKAILKNYKNYSAVKANIIVAAGGDGFMLNVLKKHYKLKKPFYGINCGTFGFLMNKYSSSKIVNKIIEEHNGTIKIENRIKDGVEITIMLQNKK